MKKLKFLWLLLICISSYAQAQLDGLEVTLSPSKQSYMAADPLDIEFSLSNTSDRSLHVLKWSTPFEGVFNADMFEITFGSARVPYTGKLVKRLPPKDRAYLKLLPGESISTRIDLSQGYDLGRAGQYTVRFRDRMLKTSDQALSFQRGGRAQTRSATITLQLVEDRPQRVTMKVAAENFVACSAQQQTIVSESLISAQAITQESVRALNNTPVEGRRKASRFIHWFGAYQSSRYDTVTSHFNNISATLQNQELSFDCSCNDDIYAYVYSSGPKKIYLCNGFWPAPLMGTDSRAGVLVHEVSHFGAVVGTVDYVFGQAACAALAVSAPGEAIENADSHEYFAENTPYLSMLSYDGVNPAPWLLLLLN